jgi:hypothetical protein
VILHQWPLSIMYGILSLTISARLITHMILTSTKHMSLIHGSYFPFHRKIYNLLSLSHLTSYNFTKCNLFFWYYFCNCHEETCHIQTSYM